MFCTDTAQDQSTPQGDAFPCDGENVVSAEVSPSTTQGGARPQADETGVSGVAEASPNQGNAGDPCQNRGEGCEESACI